MISLQAKRPGAGNRLLYLTMTAAAVFASVKLAPYLIPLAVAFAVAGAVERPVRALVKLGLKRPLAAGLMVFLFTCVAGVLAIVLVSTVLKQGRELLERLPQLIAFLQVKLLEAHQLLDSFSPQIASFLRPGDWLSGAGFTPSVILSAAKAVFSLPGTFFSVIFVIMSAYFISTQRPSFAASLSRHTGKRVYSAFIQLKDFMHSSVFKWLRAQLLLFGVTFGLLLIGMAITRQRYAFVIALAIALVDLLPVLGSGMILIPWGILCLTSNDVARGVTLIIVWVCLILARNTLEPKILGAQIGQNPFVTLLCIYFGFQAGGVTGMLVAPFVMLCVKKLYQLGYLRF